MEERILLVDSDVFILFAAAGVLERVAELLGFRLRDVRRLPALPQQLQRSRAFRQRYPEHARLAGSDWCGRIAPLKHRPALDAVAKKLMMLNDIDSGEAEMLSHVAESPFYYLASGDKRSMIALATAPELADIRAAVAGRIICLEAVLALLIRADGPEPVTAAFTPLRTCHKSLTIFFSETDCLDAVQDYLDNLVKQTGEGFLMIP